MDKYFLVDGARLLILAQKTKLYCHCEPFLRRGNLVEKAEGKRKIADEEIFLFITRKSSNGHEGST
jgi:Tfp pilus assembly protein PilZ